MIKFFRHIRKTLIMENKTSKYFKYAIGEIVLVVIGILIALSINNWNEKRKQKISGRVYLERLIEDLETDTKYYGRLETSFKKELINLEELIDTFLLKQNYKGLEYIINNLDERLPELIVKTKTYDEMVSTGALFFIDNKKVLTEIQEYYTWSERNQYFFKADNNDMAAHWQKPFYSHITIARHYVKNKQSFDHLDLSSFYSHLRENNIDLRAYLFRYQHITTAKLNIFKAQLEYSIYLIETLKNEISIK